MSPKKGDRKDPAYLREQGNLNTRVKQSRKITFSFTKQIPTQGQTIEEWGKLGLLEILCLRMKYVGQFSTQEALQNGCIKQYTKVHFPPESEFTAPKHIIDVIWAVMHITKNSFEVVAGYIEEDVFYIIFLDKDHKFWPTSK
jgi:hypothetical protein